MIRPELDEVVLRNAAERDSLRRLTAWLERRATISRLAEETRRRTLAADPEASLADLITRAVTQTIDDDDPRLPGALDWARVVRGPGVGEEDVLDYLPPSQARQAARKEIELRRA